MFKFEHYVTQIYQANFVIFKRQMNGVHSFERYPNTFVIYQWFTLRKKCLDSAFVQQKSTLLHSILDYPPLFI